MFQFHLVLALMFLLQAKHVAADFLYQPAWMYANKDMLGYWGGISHSLLHGIATFSILIFFCPIAIAMIISAVEIPLHYFIDWGKMNLSAYKTWTAATSENFWRLLGVDQWLHQMCYIGIVWIAGIWV